MTSREKILTTVCMVCIFIMMFVSIDISVNKIEPRKLSDKKLKCIDNKLYEQVNGNIYVTNHLACFEQRTF